MSNFARNMKLANLPMTHKLNSDQMKYFKNKMKEFYDLPSDVQDLTRSVLKPPCDQFYETEEYESGDTNYKGYVVCCEGMGWCGGLSGWVIFLIILLVLGALAGGAAAFYFFYWKRKNGGKDEESIEEDDNTDSTKSSDVVEVEIGKY